MRKFFLRVNDHKLTTGIALGIILLGLVALAACLPVFFEQWTLINKVLVFVGIISITILLSILVMSVSYTLKVLFVITILTSSIGANYPLTQVQPVIGGARPGPELWLVDFPLVGLLVLLLARASINSKYKLRIPPLSILFATFIMWELLTVLTAQFPMNTLFQVVQSMRGLVLFTALYNFITDKGKLYLGVKMLAIAVIFHSFFGIAQWLHQGPFGLSFLGELSAANVASKDVLTLGGVQLGNLRFGTYVSGLTNSVYGLGALGILTLPLVLSLYWRGPFGSRRSPIFLFYFGIMIFAIFLTMSRTSWAGAFISLFMFYVLWSRCKAKPNTDLGPFGSAPAGRHIMHTGRWILVLLAVLAFAIIFGDAISARLFQSNLANSFRARLSLLEAAWDRFTGNPLLGIGSNNFPMLFEGTEHVAAHKPVHNIYATFLVELGIVGLGLFFILILRIYAIGMRLLRWSGEALTASILAGITGFLAAIVFDHHYRELVPYLVFWVMIAVLISRCKLRIETRNSG